MADTFISTTHPTYNWKRFWCPRDGHFSLDDGEHGLYLVGWFVCPQWDDTDGRKKNTPKWNLHDAQGFGVWIVNARFTTLADNIKQSIRQ
jgi:hypothetical protein